MQPFSKPRANSDILKVASIFEFSFLYPKVNAVVAYSALGLSLATLDCSKELEYGNIRVV